jgi:hypothetical protein
LVFVIPILQHKQLLAHLILFMNLKFTAGAVKRKHSNDVTVPVIEKEKYNVKS